VRLLETAVLNRTPGFAVYDDFRYGLPTLWAWISHPARYLAQVAPIIEWLNTACTAETSYRAVDIDVPQM
jgi:hypothetical protein